MKRLLFLLCFLLTQAAWVVTAQEPSKKDRGGYFDKGFVTGSQNPSHKSSFFDSSSAEEAEEGPSEEYEEEPLPEVEEVAGTAQQNGNATPPASMNENVATEAMQQTPDVVMQRSSAVIEQLKGMNAAAQGPTPMKEAEDYVKRNLQGQNPGSAITGSAALPKDIRPNPLDHSAEMLPSTKQAIDQGKSPATLSLIVTSEPRPLVIKYLQELLKTKQQQGVGIGTVYVVYPRFQIKEMLRIFEDLPDLEGLVKQLSGGDFALKPVTSVPDRYNVSSSPAWIVQADGKEHVFEGNYSPSRLFNHRGIFIGDKEGMQSSLPTLQ